MDTTDRTRHRPIPPPLAEVKVHGHDSWTVQIGWEHPDGNGTQWVIGVIYDGDSDPRRPGSDRDSVAPDQDPKLVTWDLNGDVVEGCLEVPLDTIPDAQDLLQQLAWDNPQRFTTGVTFDGRPVFIDHYAPRINFVVIRRDSEHDEVRIKLDPNDGGMVPGDGEHFDLRQDLQRMAIATTVTRQLRLTAHLDAYEVHKVDRPDATIDTKYLLLARDSRGGESVWASLHASPTEAAEAHELAQIENPSEIIGLVDLDTDDTLVPAGTTITWGPA